MSGVQYHPYHIVEPRPWPIVGSIGVGLTASGLVVLIYFSEVAPVLLGFSRVAVVAGLWWRDVCREATYIGDHTEKVQIRIRWGIGLFITSEVLFFFSFFWAYFNISLAPGIEVGFAWPPVGVEGFNPFGIPLLNTTILLTSGLTVTWSHHSIIGSDLPGAKQGLALTVSLGVVFTAIQGYEYIEASFTFADSVYGRCFFIATGFHGLHVIIGRVFLSVIYLRLASGHFSSTRHFGFEGAAWYWHFVDVVWIFLFVSIYWWGR
jgi:cytochrome c oxidase subunit 3